MRPVLVRPNWPRLPGVHAFTTTRMGGVGAGAWKSFNLSQNCGDSKSDVKENRARLRSMLPEPPKWMKQVHGTAVVAHDGDWSATPEADAMVSFQPRQVCAVLTADCLPVVFTGESGDRVGVAHAGWRGLADGVLERTIAALDADPATILAWLGPGIGPRHYEVGPEVRSAFMDTDHQASSAFRPFGKRYLADLYLIAWQRLFGAGVKQVFGGGICTYADDRRFFSYRRDGVTGRMATVAWLE